MTFSFRLVNYNSPPPNLPTFFFLQNSKGIQMSQLKDHQIFYLCKQKVFEPYKRPNRCQKKKNKLKGQIGLRKGGNW